MYMHENLALCDTLGSCLASAAVRWYWHVGGGPRIWPVAVKKKTVTHTRTHTHAKGQSILGDILQTVGGS